MTRLSGFVESVGGTHFAKQVLDKACQLALWQGSRGQPGCGRGHICGERAVPRGRHSKEGAVTEGAQVRRRRQGETATHVAGDPSRRGAGACISCCCSIWDSVVTDTVTFMIAAVALEKFARSQTVRRGPEPCGSATGRVDLVSTSKTPPSVRDSPSESGTRALAQVQTAAGPRGDPPSSA